MDNAVTWTAEGDVAHLVLASPPANLIDPPLCAAIAEALDAAVAAGARVIVLRGTGAVFSGGIDPERLEDAEASAALARLCRRIEDLPAPVLVALNGPARGGGAELALAAHLRIAGAAAGFALPDIALGLVPCAGGAQRLARLVGARDALAILLSGETVDAATAQAIGLFDAVVGGDLTGVDLTGAALALAADIAAEIAAGGAPPPPTRDRTPGDPRSFMNAVAQAREAARPADLAHAAARIIDCVEAALLLPTEAAFAYEAAAFEECLADPRSTGLRHAARAQRLAAKVPEAGIVPVLPQRLALAGAGPVVAVLARAFLDAGLAVTLYEPDPATLAARIEAIALHQEKAVTEGRLDPALREAQWARLDGTAETQALREADAVVLVAAEADGAGRQPDGTAAARAGAHGATDAADAGLAALASTLSPDCSAADLWLCHAPRADLSAIGRAAGQTGRLAGLNVALDSTGAAPALIEVVATAHSTAGHVAAALALAQLICPSVIRSRMPPRWAEPAGAAAEPAEAATTAPPGPAPSVTAALERGLALAADAILRKPGGAELLARALAAQGYGATPALAAALDAAERGQKEYAGAAAEPAPCPEDEIRAAGALVAAGLANQGARLLSAGMIARPSDLDLAMIAGFGFPRHQGGPMMAADRMGLAALRNRLKQRAGTDGAFWTPAPLIDELIRYGHRFADLDRA